MDLPTLLATCPGALQPLKLHSSTLGSNRYMYRSRLPLRLLAACMCTANIHGEPRGYLRVEHQQDSVSRSDKR
jgi:hypothetical protein